jgi:hypothetical protein
MLYRAYGKTPNKASLMVPLFAMRLCRSYVDPVLEVVLVLEAASSHPAPVPFHPQIFSKPSRIVLAVAVAAGVWPLSSTFIRLHLKLTPPDSCNSRQG